MSLSSSEPKIVIRALRIVPQSRIESGPEKWIAPPLEKLGWAVSCTRSWGVMIQDIAIE